MVRRVLFHTASFAAGLVLLAGGAATPSASGAGAVGAAPGSRARTRQGAKLPPVKEVKTTRIGDVTVSNFDSASGSIDFSNTTLMGKGTTIEAPDTASHSVLKLHANKIHLLHPNDKRTGRIDLTGEVTYSITQQMPDGTTRTVEGTAGQATFGRGAQKIEFRDAPQVLLSDPARLSGPARLRAAAIDVDMSVSPYKVVAEGDPATTDIRFTPRDAPGQAGTHGGEVHIHHFRNGAFQPGELAKFDGAETTIETSNPADNSKERLHADHINATFAADHASLQQAVADGNVRYHIEHPGVNGAPGQTIVGKSATAVYDPVAAQVELTGAVVADLFDASALQEPAQVTGDRVVAHLKQPYRYEVTGAPERTSLKFSPRRPTPVPGDPPKAPGFAFGNAVINGFASAVFEPGKQVMFTGDKTSFQAGDPEMGSSVRILAPRLVATFLDDSSIGRTEASGKVRFHISQPAASGKSRQSVDGDATTATFVTTGPTREIQATGPMRIEVNDKEHLKEPGHISGEVDDILKFNLATQVYEFQIDSKNQTAKVDFVPLDPEAAPTASPAPPAGKTPATHVKKPIMKIKK